MTLNYGHGEKNYLGTIFLLSINVLIRRGRDDVRSLCCCRVVDRRLLGGVHPLVVKSINDTTAQAAKTIPGECLHMMDNNILTCYAVPFNWTHPSFRCLMVGGRVFQQTFNQVYFIRKRWATGVFRRSGRWPSTLLN